MLGLCQLGDSESVVRFPWVFSFTPGTNPFGFKLCQEENSLGCWRNTRRLGYWESAPFIAHGRKQAMDLSNASCSFSNLCFSFDLEVDHSGVDQI